MHAAPAVRYPVERSRAALALLAAGWTAGALTILWWSFAAPPGWRQGMAAAVLLGVGAFGLASWLRGPRGSIAWDGAAWTLALARGQGGGAGRVEPGVDLQGVLLLRWQPETGSTGWLWLERGHAPEAWDALRRAVYSRARTAAPPGVQTGKNKPPVASP